MPVVEWDGEPLFGGKTIVMSGARFKRRSKPTPSSGRPSVDEYPLPSTKPNKR